MFRPVKVVLFLFFSIFICFLHNSQANSHLAYIFYKLIFGLLMYLISHFTMPDPLPNSIHVQPNPLLDLNFKITLNPETSVHDDMYNVAYQLPDTL